MSDDEANRAACERLINGRAAMLRVAGDVAGGLCANPSLDLSDVDIARIAVDIAMEIAANIDARIAREISASPFSDVRKVLLTSRPPPTSIPGPGVKRG